MSKNGPEIQRAVAAALRAVLKRAEEQEKTDGPMALDIREAKLIIFSDHHKGNHDGADDFHVCEPAYSAALAHYDGLGYTLVLLGDVEELWEERPNTVLKTYAPTFELEGKFHKHGRYIRLWGNHDDVWSHSDLVEQLLKPALGGGVPTLREALILHVLDGSQELGRIFLLHGHQGTIISDRLAWFSRFMVRHVWRPIQRLIKYSNNTPAKDFQLRHEHDAAMYCWSAEQSKLVLISGHTHRPVFKSETHEAQLRRSLMEVEEALARDPGNPELEKQRTDLVMILGRLQAGRGPSSADLLSNVQFRKPSYFNTGCCAFSDGDVTGLEISDGEIRLVRWPDDEGHFSPKVLACADLRNVFKQVM